MKKHDPHREAIFGNPLSIRARAPGTVYSKELLNAAVETLVKIHKKKKKIASKNDSLEPS